MRWVPVTERLPNIHEDVLISYRYKKGEGDQSHVHITITSMSDNNPFWVHLKTEPYWNQPFQYFNSNYEVVAWMPLPEPYIPVGIDVVEVVRCMDCKYLQCNMRQDGSLPLGVDEYECRHWCGSCDPTNFCSYGERREV